MSTCKNCGVPTKYEHCGFCADWLARIDSHKIKLRQAQNRPAGPNKRRWVRYHAKALEDYDYLLGLRRNPKKGLTAKEYRMAEANK